MKPSQLSVSVALALAIIGTSGTECAFAQSQDDMRKQIELLQQQVQMLKDRLDKQESQQARPATQAQTGTAAGGGGHGFLERKEGDGVTFYTRGGEVSVYGNLDLSIDSTTKGISGFTAPRPGFATPGDGVLAPFGNGGWMAGISSNLTYVGVRGFQTLGDTATNFVYQLETQIDVSATSGTGFTNSNQSNQVKGGLTSRNSFIGLAAPAWGAVKIGKTDAPYKNSTARMNAFSGMLGDYAVIMGNTGGDNRVEFGTRVNHALWYESPNWNGINFNALISPGQNRANDSSNVASGEADCAGGNIPGSGGLAGACNDGSFSNAYSISASYTGGPLYVTAAYEMHKKVNRTSDLPAFDPTDIADENAGKIGLQYTFPTKTTVSLIWEDMKRHVPSALDIQNERTRTGYWFAVSQDISSADSLHFGWAHANHSPGDPGQHNTLPLTGLGNANPDNAANMYTIAWKHKVDKAFSVYANYAETINHALAHYDLGAGGRGLTTDCHDASTTDTSGFDPSGGAPRCWAGGHLKGVSLGMKYVF